MTVRNYVHWEGVTGRRDRLILSYSLLDAEHLFNQPLSPIFKLHNYLLSSSLCGSVLHAIWTPSKGLFGKLAGTSAGNKRRQFDGNLPQLNPWEMGVCVTSPSSASSSSTPLRLAPARRLFIFIKIMNCNNWNVRINKGINSKRTMHVVGIGRREHKVISRVYTFIRKWQWYQRTLFTFQNKLFKKHYALQNLLHSIKWVFSRNKSALRQESCSNG